MVSVNVNSEENGNSTFDEKSKLLPATDSAPIKKDRHALGLLCVAASTVFFSLMSTMIRLGSTSLPSPYLAFCRAVMQLTVSVTYAAVYKINPFGPPEARPFLVLRGVAGFMGISCVYYALRFLPVGDTQGPVMSIFMAAFFLGEELDSLTLVAAACAFAGVTFIAGPNEVFAPVASSAVLHQRILGVFLALGQAVFSSLSYIMIRKVSHQVNAVVVVFYFGFFVTLLMPLEGWIMGTSVFMMPSSAWEWMIVLCSSSLAICGNVLVSIGLQLTGAGRANSMRNLLVVFSFLFGWLILGERPQIWSIIGSTIIVAATGIIAYDSVQKARRQQYKELEDEVEA